MPSTAAGRLTLQQMKMFVLGAAMVVAVAAASIIVMVVIMMMRMVVDRYQYHASQLITRECKAVAVVIR